MSIRISKAMKELNIGFETVVKYLNSTPELELENEFNPNTKLSDSQYEALLKQFAHDKIIKKKAGEIIYPERKKKNINPKKQVQPQRTSPTYLPETQTTSKSPVNTSDLQLLETVEVPLYKLIFEYHHIYYLSNTDRYILFNKGISSFLNSHKNLPALKSGTAEIVLVHSDHSFFFKNQSVLNWLTKLSTELEKEILEGRKKINEKRKIDYKYKKKTKERSITFRNINISLSQLRIGNRFVKLFYKKEVFVFSDSSIKEEFQEILSQYFNSISKKQKDYSFYAKSIKVIINKDRHTFEFVDFSLYKYVMNIKESYLRDNYERATKNENGKHEVLEKKTTNLNIDNIEFFDSYYNVIVIDKEKRNHAITPLKIQDEYSHFYLRRIYPYFSDRFPKDIIIEYNDEKVLGITPEIKLCQYIRTLDHQKDVHGEWWEDVQNELKPTLSHCRNSSLGAIKKIVSLKNSYLVSLVGMQNEQMLIDVFEINHGKQEEAFIFTVTMPDDKCAIIFENVSDKASTSSEVFITKNKNYETCINLVFDYFTNYTISNKRDPLRKGKYSPNKFKAEMFYNVVHGKYETWLTKISQILKPTSHASKIAFVPGLHVPRDVESRSGSAKTNPKNIHNELMRRLYSQLCNKYGKENVGTENRTTGAKRLDVVVRFSDGYDIYEIKSDPDPLACVTIALGQILQYVYLYCRDEIGKMIIVGSAAPNTDVEEFLSWARKKHSMNVYYMQV